MKAGCQPEVKVGLGAVGQASLRLSKPPPSLHEGDTAKNTKSTLVFGLNSK